ncbi:MAG: serine/threonine-protein kinase [Chitinophagia bacterium]|nr:serine/threonine-protein kinase [Chitinophagia bacterium]
MLILNAGDTFAEYYTLVGLIDSGGFADVWEAIYERAHERVALKIYPNLDKQGIKVIEEEYEKQRELSHQYLITARYFGYHQGYPFFVMRYCEGGNASKLIGNCDEATAAQCIYQIGAALQYLHDDCDIIHKDIKPNNFLRDAKGNFYLADLGLSLKLRSTIKRNTEGKLSEEAAMNAGLAPMPYRAPELLDNARRYEEPVKSSDIWAFGASLFEMLTGDPPFGELGGKMQQSDADIPSLPPQFSRELNYILHEMLLNDTWKRPAASKFVRWVADYKQTRQYLITPAQGSQPPPPMEQKRSPAGLWIGIGVAVAVVAGGTLFLTNQQHNAAELQPVVTTNPDTVAIGAVMPARTDTATPKKGQNETAESGTEQKTPPTQVNHDETAEPAPEATTALQYTQGTSPGNASIASIEKAGSSRIKVVMNVSIRDGVPVEITGPGNNEKSFYLKAGGENYRAVSVSPTGRITSGSRTVTVVFNADPSSISNFDIIHGENQDDQEKNYLNFRNWRLR